MVSLKVAVAPIAFGAAGGVQLPAVPQSPAPPFQDCACAEVASAPTPNASRLGAASATRATLDAPLNNDRRTPPRPKPATPMDWGFFRIVAIPKKSALTTRRKKRGFANRESLLTIMAS